MIISPCLSERSQDKSVAASEIPLGRMFVTKFLFGQSKQDISKNDDPVQKAQVEGVDAAEPSTDVASAQEVLVVSPSHAIEIMSDTPDQSTEELAIMVNDLAHREVSKSALEPPVSGKRKRQQADEMEGPPRKRVAKESEATGNGNGPCAKSTNGITGHEDSSNRASSEAVQGNSKKLGRPTKRHMIQTYPAVVEKSDKMWDCDSAPCHEKQAENVAQTSTIRTRTSASTEMTSRGPGRPRKTVPTKKGQNEKSHDLQVKPQHKQVLQGTVSSDLKARQGNDRLTENLLQKAGPNAPSNYSRANRADIHENRPQNFRSTRSSAAASRSKDIPSDTNTERLAVHTGNGEGLARARAQEASDESQDESGNVDVNPNIQSSAHENSTQINERDEGDAEYIEEDSDAEGSVQTIESDENEGGVEEAELFGQHEAWKTVLNGTHSICGPKLPLNHMPKLLTTKMKELLCRVREARDVYDQLLPFKGLSHDLPDGLNDELRDRLDAIELQIRTLSEQTAASEAGKMIRDIFARAIPAMIFLQRSALVSRLYHSNEPCDLETLNEIVSGLREIIRLQRMTILLCEKAKNWKAKPVSTNPIKAPTTQKIFPRLRDLKDAFSKVLLEQDRRRKSKQNAVDYKIRQQERTEFLQQANQEAARKDETWHQRIRESREREDERRRNEKRTLRQILEDEARARMGAEKVNGDVKSGTSWSDAEDLELYFELEKGYVGNMTCMLPEKSPFMLLLFANHSYSYGTVFKHTEHSPVAE